jgi:hypothetical protein
MTEARLVTREQLLALLKDHSAWPDEAADAIFAALPAAAPAEGLREALIRLVEQPEEPLDADGFCKHGLLAGVACSVWEHEPWEQARAALARHESGSE